MGIIPKDEVDSLPRSLRLLGWIQLIERTSPRGWGLVIRPQECRIGLCHGRLHIHLPTVQGTPQPLPDRPLRAVRQIVRSHVEARGTIVFRELLEELR